ncbi:ras-related protein Rab-28-like [Homarus americanus]|uniref:Ras-related protein Rab-28-like n=1 Tax=Homarus americanus TaxID=6706 RepID=A0A8J5JN88_HOMAM|nr:ras-related protein Rab-28-like [Homarus americanus]XP_042239438.1 ras-related protein Rab-28-like [Homarus americanus]KAG7159281.1 Ras-related protein Rab-28-like [Homarus americanus]
MSDSEDEAVERQVKVVLVGSPQVGKTSLALRYTQDTINKSYQASMGVDFYLKRLVLGNERNVNVQIWDVAGSALAGKMTDKYLYGAHAIMFVYDVTNSNSLDTLQDWVTAVRRAARAQERPPILALVANKADLEHARQVKSERHHRFANEHGMTSYVVSAKTGEGVSLSFQKVAAELLGIRLTKAEQEQQQPVVTAEILTFQEAALPKVPQAASSSTSSVCNLM